jgi:hypothetical protein
VSAEIETKELKIMGHKFYCLSRFGKLVIRWYVTSCNLIHAYRQEAVTSIFMAEERQFLKMEEVSSPKHSTLSDKLKVKSKAIPVTGPRGL